MASNNSTKRGTPSTQPPESKTVGLSSKSALQTARITPHAVFLLCIERAQNLLKIHETAHGNRSRPELYLSDAHRAAIVLAISALDAFIRTFVIEKIRDVWTNNSSPLPQSLLEQVKRLIKDDQLIEAARKDELLSKLIKVITQDFETKSFQGVKNITQCLQLIGHEDIFHKIARDGKMNEENLRDELARFTKRRHMIAHQGDHDLSQNPPILNSIRKKDAEDCIKLVKKIARFINEI